MKQLSFFLLFLFPSIVIAQVITTIAGNGSHSVSGDGVTAVGNPVIPQSCVMDKAGNLFFVEESRIRKISSSGIISTIAGLSDTGYNGDGIAASIAKLNRPEDIAIDSAGNLFIADTYNDRIRKIDAATGIITTIAGDGTSIGPSITEGANATDISLPYVVTICISKSGEIYFVLGYGQNAYICKITSAGTVSFLTGDSWPVNLLYNDPPLPAASVHVFNPRGICLDALGNLYVTYGFNPPNIPTEYGGILKIDTAGMLYKYAGTGFGGYSGDGGMAINAMLSPCKITADKFGNIYYTDVRHAVRRIDPSGMICAVAGDGSYGYSGDGGPATAAQLYFPTGVTTDTAGNLYFVDESNYRIRKVTDPVCGYINGLGVEKVQKEGEILLFPNPVINSISITSSQKITHVEIMNLLGKIVYTHSYNSESVSIDVAALPPGIYFVRINRQKVRKIVKQ